MRFSWHSSFSFVQLRCLLSAWFCDTRSRANCAFAVAVKKEREQLALPLFQKTGAILPFGPGPLAQSDDA
jgi:hypothetical protein